MDWIISSLIPLMYRAMCAKSLQSGSTLCEPMDYSPPGSSDPMDCIVRQVPLSMGFSREEYWSGLSLNAAYPQFQWLNGNVKNGCTPLDYKHTYIHTRAHIQHPATPPDTFPPLALVILSIQCCASAQSVLNLIVFLIKWINFQS